MRVTPRRITAAYALLSGAWILLSDATLAALGLDATVQAEIGAAKGLGFVAVSSVVVFLLARSLATQADHARRAGEQAAAAEVDAARREATARAQYEHLVAQAPISIVETTRDGIVRAWNPAAERLWGLPATAAIGRFAPWVAPEERLDFLAQLQRVAGGEPITGATRARRRVDGTPIVARISKAPVVQPDGTTTIVHVAEDVTGQALAERELAAAADRLDGLHALDRAILEAQTPEQVASVAVEHLARVMPRLQAAIVLVDHETQRMEALAATSGPVKGLPAPGTAVSFAAAAPLPGRLVTTADHAVVDVAREPGLGEAWLVARESGVRSILAFPLRDGTRVVRGALILGIVDGEPMDDRAGALAGEVASQLEIAIRAARDREELKLHAERLAASLALDRAILGAESSEAIAQIALYHLGRLVTLRRAAVTLFDPASDRATLLASFPDPGPRSLPLDALAPVPGQLAAVDEQVLIDLAAPTHALGSVFEAARTRGIRWVLASPLRGADGAIIGSLTLGADERTAVAGAFVRQVATEFAASLGIALEQARLRDQVARREQRLRAVLDGSPNPILAIRGDGSIVYANPAAVRMLGTAEELIGRPFTDLVPLESRDAHRDRLAAAFADPTSMAGQHAPGAEIERGDGQRIPVAVEIAHTMGPSGPEAVITLVDLTDRVALEAQLAIAQRTELLGQFAGILAHDVRSYIRTIGWAADGLVADLDADDPRRRDAELIQEGVTEARRMLASILEFARGDAPSGSTHLSAHLDRLGGILDRLLGPDVTLEVDLPSDLPPVALAPASITQILVNLASNAADSMPDGGIFRVKGRPWEVGPSAVPFSVLATAVAPGRYVRLEVSDTGRGVAPEVARRAFETFYSTSRSPARPAAPPEGASAAVDGGSGFGLGLTSVYLTVTRARGAVAITSAPGGGATVTLDLPIADRSDAEQTTYDASAGRRT